ncbi:hypothetical protein DIPPA_08857 [Diplonema papillatum]|nr:hypothetical protein DIPPA_08857 [Diplonema papillatum]
MAVPPSATRAFFESVRTLTLYGRVFGWGRVRGLLRDASGEQAAAQREGEQVRARLAEAAESRQLLEARSAACDAQAAAAGAALLSKQREAAEARALAETLARRASQAETLLSARDAQLAEAVAALGASEGKLELSAGRAEEMRARVSSLETDAAGLDRALAEAKGANLAKDELLKEEAAARARTEAELAAARATLAAEKKNAEDSIAVCRRELVDAASKREGEEALRREAEAQLREARTELSAAAEAKTANLAKDELLKEEAAARARTEAELAAARATLAAEKKNALDSGADADRCRRELLDYTSKCASAESAHRGEEALRREAESRLREARAALDEARARETERVRAVNQQLGTLHRAAADYQARHDTEQEALNQQRVTAAEAARNAWKGHEAAVQARMKELCRRHGLDFVETPPFRGKPDATLLLTDEYVVFEAKSPGADDGANFPSYIKTSCEQLVKYAKQDAVRNELFLVVPQTALPLLSDFVFQTADYTVFIVSIEAVEPLLVHLKKLEAYKTQDGLTLDDQESIGRILGKLTHFAKRKVQVDLFFARQLRELMFAWESALPPEFLDRVEAVERVEKLNAPVEKRAKSVAAKELIKDAESISNDMLGKGVSDNDAALCEVLNSERMNLHSI